MTVNNGQVDRFLPFTRPDDMRGVLEQHVPALFGHAVRISSCEIVQTYWKTFAKSHSVDKSTLSICYRLGLIDHLGQSCGERLLYLKAYLGGRSHTAFKDVDHARSVAPNSGTAVLHMPDLDAVAWRFPNDPGLPHLPDVVERERLVAHLPYAVLGLGECGPRDIRKIDREIINYRPELRCTTRIELQLARPDGPCRLVLYAKTFKADAGRVIYDRMQELWRASLDKPGGLEVAQPLAYDPSIKTIWQLGVDGTPLGRMFDAGNCAHYVDQIAHGLARLHRSTLPTDAIASVEGHLAELTKKTAKIRRHLPRFGPKLSQIEADLARALQRLPQRRHHLIHGDFHIGQLLVGRDRIVFFDFDELAIGDPAQDLANFIVDLQSANCASHVVEQVRVLLPQAYARHSGEEVPEGWLNWHVLLQLANKAYRCFLRHEPDLVANLGSLFCEIERARKMLRETVGQQGRRAA